MAFNLHVPTRPSPPGDAGVSPTGFSWCFLLPEGVTTGRSDGRGGVDVLGSIARMGRGGGSPCPTWKLHGAQALINYIN